jgi:hypothetical protein
MLGIQLTPKFRSSEKFQIRLLVRLFVVLSRIRLLLFNRRCHRCKRKTYPESTFQQISEIFSHHQHRHQNRQEQQQRLFLGHCHQCLVIVTREQEAEATSASVAPNDSEDHQDPDHRTADLWVTSMVDLMIGQLRSLDYRSVLISHQLGLISVRHHLKDEDRLTSECVH